jgi:hypothetical protein
VNRVLDAQRGRRFLPALLLLPLPVTLGIPPSAFVSRISGGQLDSHGLSELAFYQPTIMVMTGSAAGLAGYSQAAACAATRNGPKVVAVAL